MNLRTDKTQQPQSIHENSNHLYPDPNQFNSLSKYNFMRDQSINFRACLSGDYSRHIGQQQLDNPDGGNTINFWQVNRRNLFNIQAKIERQEGQLILQENQQSQIKEADPNKRKGLKYLSYILNRLLRKKKLDSNQIVAQCIENVLPKSSQNPNYQKESQNIRRRIYDAINVMSAIGLVIRNGPSEIFIRKNQNGTSFCYEPTKSMNRFKFIESNQDNGQNLRRLIKNKADRLRDKKNHLQNMKSTLNILRQHIQRNKKIEEQEIKIIKVEEQNENIKGVEKIFFPILMIGTKQQEISIRCIGKNHHKIKIKYTQNQLKLLSQLDSLKYIHLKSAKKQQNIILKNQQQYGKQIYRQKPMANKIVTESYEQFVVSCFEKQQKQQPAPIEEQEPQPHHFQQDFIDQEQVSDRLDRNQAHRQRENIKMHLKRTQMSKSSIFTDRNILAKKSQQKNQLKIIKIQEDDQNSNKILS